MKSSYTRSLCFLALLALVLLALVVFVLVLVFKKSSSESEIPPATSPATVFENSTNMNARDLDVPTFAQLIESDEYIVIDVRTPEEIAEGKIIDRADEIDFYDEDFRDQIAELDRDQKYLLYCRSGNRSGKTLQLMQELGFENAQHLDGGITAWRSENLDQ